ncbi:hypothetical protein Rhal01_01865 [Rubritalea halochordaticola]|uniref:Uncharacterized protein n=1 Tax=Rubritalea halochordaticola TaxID=714537 RepID=A0ABP9UZ14_9BACT
MKPLMRGVSAALKTIAQAGKVYFNTPHGCEIFAERYAKKIHKPTPQRAKRHTGPPDIVPLKKAC